MTAAEYTHPLGGISRQLRETPDAYMVHAHGARDLSLGRGPSPGASGAAGEKDHRAVRLEFMRAFIKKEPGTEEAGAVAALRPKQVDLIWQMSRRPDLYTGQPPAVFRPLFRIVHGEMESRIRLTVAAWGRARRRPRSRAGTSRRRPVSAS